MARGSRDLAKFLQIENGKRFRGLSQISTKRKWQEVQRDFVTKKGGVESETAEKAFPLPPCREEERRSSRRPLATPQSQNKGRLV
jgi:hypothetical protein